jgi:elongation factor 1 alpha-like protein
MIDANAGSTLVDCINRLQPGERQIDKPLRFSVSDVYKSSQTSSSAISLAGKMESGSLKVGDRVVIVPSVNEVGLVKTIYSSATGDDSISVQQCFAGDSGTINVSGVDPTNIGVGSFVCDCFNPPMPVTDRIRARIIIFGLDMPIIKGFSVIH